MPTRLWEKTRMSTKETEGHKSVPNEREVQNAEIPDILREEFPDLDDEELLMWAVETGLDELAGMCEMLREEGDVYEREDGAHVVSPNKGDEDEDDEDGLSNPWRDGDEEEDADLPDWETVEERAEWGDV